jgi:hypothetical protein
VPRFEAFEGAQRIRDPAQASLADRGKVEDVAILGHLTEERHAGGQRFSESTLRDERANATHPGLDASGRRRSVFRGHARRGLYFAGVLNL